MILNSEIANLMGAVSRAETSLCDEILQIISTAAEPMCCKDIYEKSANAPDTMTLSIEVHRMTVKAGLLEVAEKKAREGFREVGFYRLTDLGHERLRTPCADLRTPCAEIRKNVTEVHKTVTDVQESATEVKPNTAKVQQTAVHQPAQKKETPVNTTAKPHGGKQPSELNTAIYNKIVEHPGITQDALIKHAQHKCPDATEKQIKKTMLNMVHATKKIRVEGERGNYTYHLNTGVSQLPAKPTKPAKPAAAGKVVFGNEAAALRGDSQPAATPASSPVAKQEVEPEFELLLSDENCLHINLGGNRFRLNPKQLARLDTFLARVLTDGVRLADGAPA